MSLKIRNFWELENQKFSSNLKNQKSKKCINRLKWTPELINRLKYYKQKGLLN